MEVKWLCPSVPSIQDTSFPLPAMIQKHTLWFYRIFFSQTLFPFDNGCSCRRFIKSLSIHGGLLIDSFKETLTVYFLFEKKYILGRVALVLARKGECSVLCAPQNASFILYDGRSRSTGWMKSCFQGRCGGLRWLALICLNHTYNMSWGQPRLNPGCCDIAMVNALSFSWVMFWNDTVGDEVEINIDMRIGEL